MGVEMTSLLLVPQMVPTYLKSISWLIVTRFLKKVAPIGKKLIQETLNKNGKKIVLQHDFLEG
jgi:hypothetical protein